MNAYLGVLGIDGQTVPRSRWCPGKVSGVPILNHTRIQADSVVEKNDDGITVEEIAAIFELPEAEVRQVVYYANQRNPPGPL